MSTQNSYMNNFVNQFGRADTAELGTDAIFEATKQMIDGITADINKTTADSSVLAKQAQKQADAWAKN